MRWWQCSFMFGRYGTVFVHSWWNRSLHFGARNVTGDCGRFFRRMDTSLLAPQSLKCGPRLPFNFCDPSWPRAMYVSTNISSRHALGCPCWCFTLYPNDVSAPSKTGESDATVPSGEPWAHLSGPQAGPKDLKQQPFKQRQHLVA